MSNAILTGDGKNRLSSCWLKQQREAGCLCRLHTSRPASFDDDFPYKILLQGQEAVHFPCQPGLFTIYGFQRSRAVLFIQECASTKHSNVRRWLNQTTIKVGSQPVEGERRKEKGNALAACEPI